MSLHNDITCNHLQFKVGQIEEELKNHYDLLEWLVERVAGLEALSLKDRASVDPSPLSEIPTVPRRNVDVTALKFELDSLRERVQVQETRINDDAQLIERLRADLDAAREETINITLERDRERAQSSEWLVQLHDAKKELVRATSILEAIRTVTEELGFEMPEDLF